MDDEGEHAVEGVLERDHADRPASVPIAAMKKIR